MKGFFLLWILATGLLPCTAQEQSAAGSSLESSPHDFMIGANLGIPFPAMANAIKNNMGNTGFGISGMFLANPSGHKPSVLRLGGEIGYTYYGRFKTDVVVNGFGGDYKTSYGILTLQGIARLRPPQTGRVSPFLDLFAGGNFYVSVIRENLGFIESSLGLQPFDMGGELSASFSKGIGAGVSIGPPEKGKARFVLRLSFTDGSRFKYIVRNSLRYDSNLGSLVYETGRAPLRYMMVQVGVGL